MGIIRFGTNGFKMLAVAIVVTAVLVRALIPVGYMPGQDTAGAYTIVICSGFGTKTITVDQDGVPVQHGDENNTPSTNAEHCPFAPVLAGGAVPMVDSVVTLSFTPLPAFPWTDRIGDRFALAKATSRGPPSFV